MLTFNSNMTINCLQDLANIVAQQRSYKINIFSSEDIQRMKDTMPPTLSSLKGALLIHELQVDSSGQVLSKQFPSDPNYVPVEIRGSYALLPANRLAQPELATFVDA